MQHTVVVGVDTGNKCIKTRNHNFVSGIVCKDFYVSGGGSTIRYNNKYYQINDSRIVYRIDKTINDDYFVLTLFAIIKELQSRGYDIYNKNNELNIILALGLPPQHIQSLGADFKSILIEVV